MTVRTGQVKITSMKIRKIELKEVESYGWVWSVLEYNFASQYVVAHWNRIDRGWDQDFNKAINQALSVYHKVN